MKKFKRVVVLGCSCAFGSELVHPGNRLEKNPKKQFINDQEYRLSNCFGGVIANRLSAKLDNFAVPASSIGHMRWQLQNWLSQTSDPENSLVLAAYTSPDRESWFYADYKSSHIKADAAFNRHVHTRSLIHEYIDPALDPDWAEMHKIWLKHSYSPEWEQYNYEQTVMFIDGVAKLKSFDVVKNTGKSTLITSLLYEKSHIFPRSLAKRFKGSEVYLFRL